MRLLTLTSIEAVCSVAVLCPPEPEEALPLDGVVLPVVVEVHLHVRGADVHLARGVKMRTWMRCETVCTLSQPSLWMQW